jgi:hypothetical protein
VIKQINRRAKEIPFTNDSENPSTSARRTLLSKTNPLGNTLDYDVEYNSDNRKTRGQ